MGMVYVPSILKAKFSLMSYRKQDFPWQDAYHLDLNAGHHPANVILASLKVKKATEEES
jgi:hypothetical protein